MDGIEDHPQVGIIGTNALAVGLIEICARSGCDVLVVDSPEALERDKVAVEHALAFALEARRSTPTENEAALSRIRYTSDEPLIADRSLVFDTTPVYPRDPAPTVSRVARLDRLMERPEAVLVITASDLPLSQAIAETAHPWRVLAARLLAPVETLTLMELVTAPATRPQIAFRVGAFITAVLGKNLIHSHETPFFAEDAMPVPYVLSAIRMSESTFTTVDEVDAAALPGCNQPIGPLEFADILGLDVLVAVVEALYREYPQAMYELPESLVERVRKGHLGRKAGRGFFRYPGDTGLHVVTAPTTRRLEAVRTAERVASIG